MKQRRTRNSDLKLLKIEETEAEREPDEGILELFHRDAETPDADAPLARDDSSE